ncbi:AsnC family protein [Bilophila wadsworthia]|uniref:AsnC family protein n=1 Tax=Bilophila wadsworthia TaxID=35833 RepID=UPI00242A3ACC|nr:AsnC family protein [Bilophila wadsworthia]
MLAKPLPCADEKKGDLFDEAIMRELKENPEASCRVIAAKVGLSKSTVANRMKALKA